MVKRTVRNGLTFYTEKSQTFKKYENRFLSFVFHNDWLQNNYLLPVKSKIPNLVVVVNVLLHWIGYDICTFLLKKLSRY